MLSSWLISISTWLLRALNQLRKVHGGWVPGADPFLLMDLHVNAAVLPPGVSDNWNQYSCTTELNLTQQNRICAVSQLVLLHRGPRTCGTAGCDTTKVVLKELPRLWHSWCWTRVNNIFVFIGCLHGVLTCVLGLTSQLELSLNKGNKVSFVWYWASLGLNPHLPFLPLKHLAPHASCLLRFSFHHLTPTSPSYSLSLTLLLPLPCHCAWCLFWIGKGKKSNSS